MGFRDLAFLGLVIGGALLTGRGILRPASPSGGPTDATPAPSPRPGVVAEVDEAFRAEWRRRGVRPAPPASELTVMRRLNLGLAGAIPSLEEVRRFEAMPAGRRLDAWADALLRDRRTADHLAERLARAYVGVEDGPFLVFRRRRFAAWLGDALMENRPYSTIVRDLIAAGGLWTDRPAVNFLSATRDEATGRPDPERLAARASRAFLGIRIDCAQCHDHPFQPWRQSDFRGLAAFFDGLRSNLRGVFDSTDESRPPGPRAGGIESVVPRVPARPDLLPAGGPPRDRLASWVTAPGNPYFARAAANRVWAVLFGRPLVDPVDDIPAADAHPALDALAADFDAHGHDLRRLIRSIAATEAYRLESLDLPDEATSPNDESWAAFPMTRLRPDQVAGGLVQASSLQTLGPRSPWPERLASFTERNDFIRRYGDAGEDEFAPIVGTLPQRLLLMNGDLVSKRLRGEFAQSVGRIAALAPDDATAVEAAYLGALTRRPTPDEAAHFASRLSGTSGDARTEVISDLFWTLLNSAEFSWNH